MQAVMGGDGDAEMPSAVFKQVVQGLNARLTVKQVEHIFALLDVDCSGAITVAEFLRLPAALAQRLPDEVEEARSQNTTSIRSFWSAIVFRCHTAVTSRWFNVHRVAAS